MCKAWRRWHVYYQWRRYCFVYSIEYIELNKTVWAQLLLYLQGNDKSSSSLWTGPSFISRYTGRSEHLWLSSLHKPERITRVQTVSEVGIHATITFGTPSKVHNWYCRQTAVQFLSVLRLVISVNNANITHHAESCHGKVETFQG